MKKKQPSMWGGRFTEPTDDFVEAFNAHVSRKSDLDQAKQALFHKRRQLFLEVVQQPAFVTALGITNSTFTDLQSGWPAADVLGANAVKIFGGAIGRQRRSCCRANQFGGYGLYRSIRRQHRVDPRPGGQQSTPA